MAGGPGGQRARQPNPNFDPRYPYPGHTQQSGYAGSIHGSAHGSVHGSFNGPVQGSVHGYEQSNDQQSARPRAPPSQHGGQPNHGNTSEALQRPVSGGFDGPSEHSRNPSRQNPFGTGLGYDPAKPIGAREKNGITNTRVELPATAYTLDDATVSQSTTLVLVILVIISLFLS